MGRVLRKSLLHAVIVGLLAISIPGYASGPNEQVLARRPISRCATHRVLSLHSTALPIPLATADCQPLFSSRHSGHVTRDAELSVRKNSGTLFLTGLRRTVPSILRGHCKRRKRPLALQRAGSSILVAPDSTDELPHFNFSREPLGIPSGTGPPLAPSFAQWLIVLPNPASSSHSGCRISSNPDSILILSSPGRLLQSKSCGQTDSCPLSGVGELVGENAVGGSLSLAPFLAITPKATASTRTQPFPARPIGEAGFRTKYCRRPQCFAPRRTSLASRVVR